MRMLTVWVPVCISAEHLSFPPTALNDFLKRLETKLYTQLTRVALATPHNYRASTCLHSVSSQRHISWMRRVWLELFFPVTCTNIFPSIHAHFLGALFDSLVGSFKGEFDCAAATSRSTEKLNKRI